VTCMSSTAGSQESTDPEGGYVSQMGSTHGMHVDCVSANHGDSCMWHIACCPLLVTRTHTHTTKVVTECS
jgi:hypothetical protein